MGDDAFNQGIVAIRRRFGAGQHVFGVEDIQALVLHGTGVEVIHCHDHEQVKIVFPAIGFLIPSHRPFQRVHGICAAAFVTGAHEYAQRHLAPGHCGETVIQRHQITGNQRKQICGFRVRIVPFRNALFGCQKIAIGQHHRQVAFDPDGKYRHDVRAIRIKGDPAKALCLTLGAIHAVGHVQPFKRGVGGGADLGHTGKGKGAIGQMGRRNCQSVRVQNAGIIRQGYVVDLCLNQFLPITVQHQVMGTRGTRRVGPKHDL